MDVTRSLTDPSGSSAVSDAGQWVESALLGSTAMSIAVIALAFGGLLLLSGRLDLRRGASVIVGAFILFGAAQIAAGLSGLSSPSRVLAVPVANQFPAPAPAPSPTVTPYDPYAGAAMPPR
jgi:type IV secretion system protein VirB2